MDDVLFVAEHVHLHDLVGFFGVAQDVANVLEGMDLAGHLLGVDRYQKIKDLFVKGQSLLEQKVQRDQQQCDEYH